MLLGTCYVVLNSVAIFGLDLLLWLMVRPESDLLTEGGSHNSTGTYNY